LPIPTIVGARGACGGSAGAAAGAGAPPTGAVPPFAVTTKECPHFGQRIFKPEAGTRRSSTW
jgi:hypothetical protein